ncbi:MAG: hypothetical protein HY906_28400 [Deltaproteobacteria bacterium]|nr:hypothetical protein [Deltaproteobacteria bacterium]
MARLGRDPFRDSAPRLIRVAITRAGAGLQARIVTLEPSGTVSGVRSLGSPRSDCAELAAAVGLALAIAIDPLAASGRPPETWDEPAPASQPATAPAAPDRASAPAAAEPRADGTTTVHLAPRPPAAAPERLFWFASGGALVALGSAPGVTAGLVVQVGVRRGGFSFAVEGRGDFPREASAGDGGVYASLGLALVVPCYRFSRFAACGLLAGGGLRGSAHNLGEAHQELTAFAAAGARLAAEFAVGRRFWLSIQTDLLAPLTPTSIQVDGASVWRTPAVSGTFGVMLGGRVY